MKYLAVFNVVIEGDNIGAIAAVAQQCTLMLEGADEAVTRVQCVALAAEMSVPLVMPPGGG